MKLNVASKWGRSIAFLAMSAVCVSGMIFNVGFALSVTTTLLENIVLSAVTLSLDLYKVLALSALIAAFSKGFWKKGVLITILWLCSIALGVASSLGFAATARTNAVQERVTNVENIKRDKARYTFLESKTTAATKDAQYKASNQCLDDKKAFNSNFCTEYWRDVGEMNTLSAKLSGAKETESDPQTEVFHYLFGWKKENVAYGILILLSLTIELFSAVGTYAMSPTIAVAKRKAKSTASNNIPEVEYASSKKTLAKKPKKSYYVPTGRPRGRPSKAAVAARGIHLVENQA